MAVVIGEDNSAKKECTCPRCSARISYSPAEVYNLWRGKDYSGGSAGADGFKCPRCHSDVVTRAW